MTATSKAPTADAPSLAHDSDELAADYEKPSAPQQFESGKRLAADLAIGAGERVLDVEPLPLCIEVAQARALANPAFEVGDANDLGALPEAGFDVVVLNAVFHWLPDKPRAPPAAARAAGGR